MDATFIRDGPSRGEGIPMRHRFVASSRLAAAILLVLSLAPLVAVAAPAGASTPTKETDVLTLAPLEAVAAPPGACTPISCIPIPSLFPYIKATWTSAGDGLGGSVHVEG